MATKIIVKCLLCDGRFKLGRDAQHVASKWHRVARTARTYRKAGCSFAEIGRQLGLSRYYISKKLHEEEA